MRKTKHGRKVDFTENRAVPKSHIRSAFLETAKRVKFLLSRGDKNNFD